jgi:hypothetical protein
MKDPLREPAQTEQELEVGVEQNETTNSRMKEVKQVERNINSRHKGGGQKLPGVSAVRSRIKVADTTCPG